MLIYKVFRDPEYQEFVAAGRTAGAPVDLADGYIHLSTKDQLPGTLAKHFASEDNLHLVAIESAGMEELRWETSRDNQKFPHLYRDLIRADTAWARNIRLVDGKHETGELD